MEIKDLVGDAYKEGMTLEEVAAVIKNKALVDPSTLPPSVSKETFDKVAEKLARLEQEKKNALPEDEQAQIRQQEILERMAALEKENSCMKYEKSFLAAGYTPEIAQKLANCVSDGKFEDFVKEQVVWTKQLKETLYAQAKEDLLKGTPPVGGGQSRKPGDEAVALAEQLAKSRANASAGQRDILKNYL